MAEEESSQSSSESKLGAMLPILFAVLNLLGVGTGAYLVYASTIGYKPPSSVERELLAEVHRFYEDLGAGPVMFTLEPFNTNLDGVPRRLIRMEVSLEMLDQAGFEEIFSLGAEARDTIIRILNAKNFHEIETVQGKLHLKNQIIAQLNGFLDRGVIQNVYFSDFVVQ